MADYDDPRPSSEPTGSTSGAVAKDDLITLDRIMTAPSGTEITNRKGEVLKPMVDIVGEAQSVVQAAVDAVAADTIQNTDDIADLKAKNSVTVSDAKLELTQTGAELQAILVDSASVLKAVAISAGTTVENVMLATDTVSAIVGFIYDADEQVTYSVPSDAQGKFISSFVDGVLTTSDTSAYELVTISDFTLQTVSQLQHLHCVNSSIATVTGRGHARYIVKPSGYVAEDGDITMNSGQVASLQLSNENNAEWWGLVDGFNIDSSVAMNSAITRINSNGGGKLVVPTGGFGVSNSIILKSNVLIVGQGMEASVFRLTNGANTDVFMSVDFGSLTGTGAWLVSEGVPVGFGLFDIGISGNWGNNTSGMGVKLYAKRYFIDRVMIFNTTGTSFYSECGAKVGQDTQSDMPEGYIGSIYTKNSNNNGFHYRGPHDQYIGRVAVANPASRGVLFEESEDYSGSCDVDNIHVYACGGDGVQFSCPVDVGFVESESNQGGGILIDANNVKVSRSKLYLNRQGGSGYHVLISGDGNKMSNTQIGGDNYGFGLSVTGDRNQVSNTDVIMRADTFTDKAGSSSVFLSGSSNQISAIAKGSEFGLRLSGDISNNVVNISTESCDTHLSNNSTSNQGNIINITSDVASGEAAYSGSSGLSRDNGNILSMCGTGEYKSSFDYISGSVDLGITTEQVIVIPHNLPFAPTKRQVTPSLDGGASLSSVQVQYIAVSAVSSSDVTIKFKLASTGLAASTSGLVLISCAI